MLKIDFSWDFDTSLLFKVWFDYLQQHTSQTYFVTCYVITMNTKYVCLIKGFLQNAVAYSTWLVVQN